MTDENFRGETTLQVVQKLLFASFLMLTMPIIAYFSSKKFFFEDFLQYSSDSSSMLAVIPAVIAVNLIIAFYVFLAWVSEPFTDDVTEEKKEE